MPKSTAPTMPPGTTPLFVYGTLRKTGANHALLATSTFIDLATTVERHALFVAEVPYLATNPPVHRVRGEVYAVDATTLAMLDALEGHPTWYERRPIAVVLDAAAKAAKATAGIAFADAPATLACETYFNDRPSGVLSARGDFATVLRRLARDAASPPTAMRRRR